MKKVAIVLALVLLSATGFWMVQSRLSPVRLPPQNELAVAPQTFTAVSEPLGGEVESTSTPVVGELPEVQEALPAPENSQASAVPLPLDQELSVVTPAPRPVEDFLLAVRSLTDEAQLDEEEVEARKNFLSLAQPIPESILSRLESKAQKAKEQVAALSTVEEVSEIKSLLVSFYSLSLEFYQTYRNQQGENSPVDLQELFKKGYSEGAKGDELRYDLHAQYGLGRL